MKRIFITLSIILTGLFANATIHIVKVWDGYFSFLSANITVQLGDTIQWLPLDSPSIVHTITSTNIPSGAVSFDQIWQTPVDTFFQYIPQIAGLYEYECTPHAVSHGMVGSFNVIVGSIGISDNELVDDDLAVYPNPAENFIDFGGSNTSSSFKIHALNGKTLLIGTTNGPVNISSLVNGIYFIEITGDKPRVMRFIKQ